MPCILNEGFWVHRLAAWRNQPQILGKALRKKHNCTTPHGSHCCKGDTSEFDYGQVHKPISVKEAMKIPDAESAEDKECELAVVGLQASKIKGRSGSASQEWREDLFMSHLSWIFVIWARGICRASSKVQGKSRAPGLTMSTTTMNTEQYS